MCRLHGTRFQISFRTQTMQSNDSDSNRRIERIQELSNKLTEAIESAATQRSLARQLA